MVELVDALDSKSNDNNIVSVRVRPRGPLCIKAPIWCFLMYRIREESHNNNGDIMKENINALDEIHKGACMGQDALSFVLDKVEDKKFKELLQKQFDDYDDIAKEIEEIYPKYNSEKEPHDTSIMNKAMTSMGIDMKTMSDHSNSKIAELLIQGVNMGIIEGRKILNKKAMNEEVEKIVSKYVTMQEDNLDILKKYL